MNHVFISHCHENRKFAKGCQARHMETGFTAWRSDSIPGGEDWRKEIDKAITEAFALVVVITPESKASEYVDFTSRARPWNKLVDLLREAKASKPQEPKPSKPARIMIEDKSRQKAYAQMMAALRDEKWPWRTIRRLAIIGGVPQKVAVDILAHDPHVDFAIGGRGQKIAKLKVR